MDRPSSNQGPETSWPWTWPLGGDVTQWIRTTWIKALSDQTGFININNVRAGDPEVARRIIEDRQVQTLKADTSTPRLTLAGLDRMLDDLQALKQQDRPAYQRIADRLREVISD